MGANRRFVSSAGVSDGATAEGFGSGKWRFELPRYGKTIVVREPRSGKILHKITWTGENFQEVK